MRIRKLAIRFAIINGLALGIASVNSTEANNLTKLQAASSISASQTQTSTKNTITTEDQLASACKKGGTYYVNKNIACTKAHTVSKNLTLIATGKTRAIYASKEISRVFYVKNASLTLGSGKSDTCLLKIRGRKSDSDTVNLTTNSLIALNKASLTLNSGSLCYSSSTGVKLTNSSTMTMNGGSVCKVSPDRGVNGAIMLLSNSKLTLNDGSISNNSVGGVFIGVSSSMNMNGGIISDNVGGAGNPDSSQTGGYGGGIYNKGTLRICGGTIKNNRIPSEFNGSGIYLADKSKMYAKGKFSIANTGDEANDVYVTSKSAIYLEDILENKPSMALTVQNLGIGTTIATCTNNLLNVNTFNDGSIMVHNQGDLILAPMGTQLIATKRYTISYNSDGGSSTPASTILYHGENFLIPPASQRPSKFGYAFIGWFDQYEAQYEEGLNYTATEDLQLTAKWEFIPPVWTISFEKKSFEELKLFNDLNATIAYTHYTKGPLTFTINGNRAVGDYVQEADIYYQIVAKDDTVITDQSAWKKANKGTITIKKQKPSCVYIRSVCGDKAKTIKTNGFVVDPDAPVISGVKNAAVYKKSVTIQVKDTLSGLKKVTLNGKNMVSGKTVSKAGTYKVIAYDLAGNKTKVSFKIKK